MRDIILFDTEETFGNLLPITFTRPIPYIRVGILTLLEKWQMLLEGRYSVSTAAFLKDVYPCLAERDEAVLHIDSSVLPDAPLVRSIEALKVGEELEDPDGRTIAYYAPEPDFRKTPTVKSRYLGEVRRLNYVFDIFLQNGREIKEDFARITEGKRSQPLPECNLMIGSPLDDEGHEQLFIEEGAVVEGASINVKEGPVYIGAGARIMEGACVRGPLALCAKAQIRMGAKIYGATTIGPYCKAGGELSNVVMLGYSNKSHDGYLGNAVIGEWCNIGAGVNASNLKNDYSRIRIWNYVQKRFIHTDLQFCGLIMGDHSKAGVNCMFNTATVLGVGVNVHGAGFPRVFVPSFSEGSASAGFSDVSLKKFFDIASRVMNRRGLEISEKQRAIYEHIYSVSQNHK